MAGSALGDRLNASFRSVNQQWGFSMGLWMTAWNVLAL